MKRSILTVLVVALGGGAILLLGGCESTGGHGMAKQKDGYAMACQKCYDEVKIVRRQHLKGTEWSQRRVIRKHMCPDCKTEATIYTQDGKPMIKCSKCAPEGVACDRCMPPAAKH